jgi:hypothetical protein
MFASPLVAAMLLRQDSAIRPVQPQAAPEIFLWINGPDVISTTCQPDKWWAQ